MWADLGQPTPDDLERTGRPITTGRETQALIAWRKNEAARQGIDLR